MRVLNSMGDQMDLVSRVSSAASRLSIIVPLHENEAAMEETLVSVLQNRPADSEILLCHDGSYNDPYQLCDEVELVAADVSSSSPCLIDLISAGAHAASGPFAHVITAGLTATEGWTDAALEKFEQDDCGSVAAVVRNSANQRIAAAGWTDTALRIGKPAFQGKTSAGKTANQSTGALLAASFWRTDLLNSLIDSYRGSDALTTSVAFEYLARQGGWRCMLAEECEVHCKDDAMLWGESGFRRGNQVRGLRNHFYHDGFASQLVACIAMGIVGFIRPGRLAEAIGNAFATAGISRIGDSLDASAVMTFSETSRILNFPSQENSETRRAA
jgi:hypothetical protein